MSQKLQQDVEMPVAPTGVAGGRGNGRLVIDSQRDASWQLGGRPLAQRSPELQQIRDI